MSYAIKYAKQVEKFLDKHKDLQPKVLSALEQIAQNPFDNALDIKKLQGESHKYRLRSANIVCCMKSSMNKF